MASRSVLTGSLGASHSKLSKLNFGRVEVNTLWQQNDVRAWIGRKQLQHAGLAVSQESKKTYNVCCVSSLERESTTNREDPLKEAKLSGLTSQLIPNSSEIESLVTQICNTTSITEFELKLGGFRLYVMRDLIEKSKPPPPVSPPLPLASVPVSKNSKEASDSNESVSTSLAITKAAPAYGGIQSFVDRAADEGLMILQSPRVGFFRRSRTIKGKRAPPACKEKQAVKEGQVLCYIEQLGGELPIESDVTGEVIKILREDGEPVGYSDALIAILPSFPGIKKLQ
uniref:Lipoyl-binding domain-containing protein n=1 Tax=Rhizophora mucronata TaxID=61149 RepID=A0A2P2JHQ0_RHIMU